MLRVTRGTQTGLMSACFPAAAISLAAFAPSCVDSWNGERCVFEQGTGGQQYHNHLRHGAVSGQALVSGAGFVPVHLESSTFQDFALVLAIQTTLPVCLLAG